MAWKTTKYDLLELVINIAERENISSTLTENEMLESDDKLINSVGKMLISLGCETIYEVKEEFSKFS